jgi:hypothetical protein
VNEETYLPWPTLRSSTRRVPRAATRPALREAWVEEFDKMIDEVRPFDGARDLMEAVKSRG